MSIIGDVANAVAPITQLLPQGTGAAIGNDISGVMNNFLPETYSAQHPVLNALFGQSQAYASGPSSTNTSSVPAPTNYTPQNASYGPLPSYQTTTNSGNGGGGGGSTVPSQFNQPGGFGDPNHPDLSNPFKQNLYNQYIQSQQNAAASSASANIAAATNMYNNLKSQLELQRPVIQQAYDTGLGDVNNQLQLGQQQGQANSDQLTSSYNQGMGQLGQQYQQSQGQNRELARAVGGNGSDYAQLQNRTNNSYQNNQFSAYNDYSSRLSQINQGLQSLQNWGATQKDQLASQYNQSIGQLVLNENMTDFSKADAIQKIQSDYQNQLGNINSVVAQFGNQLALAKAQVDTTAMMFGRAVQGYDPLSSMANMFYGQVGTPAPTVDTSGGISYPTNNNNNNTAGGINNTNNNAASF